MKKRILILGGFGFLGKTINNVFVGDDSYDIFNHSRRNGCDVMDIKQLLEVIITTDPDIIIYCAANVGSINYVTNYAADVMNDNVQMYLNLYKAVLEVNKNIIIINPLANCSYPGIIDVQHEDLWWNGSIHPSVESYGMSKKTSFILSECYKKQYGIKTVNLMLGGGYGENDHLSEEKTHAMNGIIMRMIKAKRNNDKQFIVWGTGAPIREWFYMPDIARIIKYIIDNEKYDLPNPMNIGQEMGISVTDIVMMVKKALNYDVEIIYDTTKQDGALIKVLGSKLFKQYFSDFEFTDYEIGIGNAIKYYNENL